MKRDLPRERDGIPMQRNQENRTGNAEGPAEMRDVEKATEKEPLGNKWHSKVSVLRNWSGL
jgi:hypothetical protein